MLMLDQLQKTRKTQINENIMSIYKDNAWRKTLKTDKKSNRRGQKLRVLEIRKHWIVEG